MPQIVVIAFGAFCLYSAYRWFRNESQRVETAMKRANSKIRRKSDSIVTPLAFDPASGEYRPMP